MIYLEMNHVRKSFGDLEVLKDISLKVEEGEVLSIIGPSWRAGSHHAKWKIRLCKAGRAAENSGKLWNGIPELPPVSTL